MADEIAGRMDDSEYAVVLDSIAWAFIELDSANMCLSEEFGWSDAAERECLLEMNRRIDDIRPVMKRALERSTLELYMLVAPNVLSMAKWLEGHDKLSWIGELGEDCGSY